MSEITGTDIFELARDTLTGLVTALIATQVTNSDDPAIGYMYQNHAPAKLQLNACTVSLDSASEDLERMTSGTGKGSIWNMSFSVRVHTSYLPHGVRDDQKVARLLNSLTNKFQKNLRPGSNLQIDHVYDVTVGDEFDESVTYGGQVMIDISLPVLQTQE